jgi:hypothetical protein
MIALQFFGQVEAWSGSRPGDLGSRQQIFAKRIGDEIFRRQCGRDRLGVEMVIQLVNSHVDEWNS